MSNLYEAQVIDTPTFDNERNSTKNRLIKVLPLNATQNCNERFAYAPSFMPYTTTGGGVTSVPPKASQCLVLSRPNYDYDLILSYLPIEAVGPEGIYAAEEQEEGGLQLKIGGTTKTMFSMSPGGNINFTAGTQCSFNVQGDAKRIEMQAHSMRVALKASLESTEYTDLHNSSLQSNVNEYKHIIAKGYEKLSLSDWEEELESVNPLGVTASYNEKVIIRAGTIYNYDNILLNKNDIGHVYQLETRQSSFSGVEKDTITCLRLGYQKALNTKLDSKTIYPAGPLIDWTAKRVTPTGYSSFLFQYGKKENITIGTAAELTQGEVYRFQIYQDVLDVIGTPGTDPLGNGLGWVYSLDNSKANEQYTESFGKLLDGTFYRFHVHEYLAGVGSSLTYTLGALELSSKVFKTPTLTYSEVLTPLKQSFIMADPTNPIAVSTIELVRLPLPSINIISDQIKIGNTTITLGSILSALVTAIETITLMTPQGPTNTGGVLNLADFQTIAANIKTLLL